MTQNIALISCGSPFWIILINFNRVIIGHAEMSWCIKGIDTACIQTVAFSLISVSHLWISSVHLWPYSQPGHLVPPPTLTFSSTHSTQFIFMEDYDVDMDEEEEAGEVFMRKATTGPWWEDCGDNGNCDIQGGGRGCMVNSRSWAEELQDIFTPQAEDSYSEGRTRLSSISVSSLSFSFVCSGCTSTEFLNLSPDEFL